MRLPFTTVLTHTCILKDGLVCACTRYVPTSSGVALRLLLLGVALPVLLRHGARCSSRDGRLRAGVQLRLDDAQAGSHDGRQGARPQQRGRLAPRTG